MIFNKGLSKAMAEALKALTAKIFSGPWRLTAKRIIMLGLAVYGRNNVLVEFLPD